LNWSTTADGRYHCALQFVTIVYDVDGKPVNVQSNGMGTNLTPAQFASAFNSNLDDPQQISVPARGEYSLRMGLHDAAANRVGAVEIPVRAVVQPGRAAEPHSRSGTQ
jgi:hypothetical protein